MPIKNGYRERASDNNAPLLNQSACFMDVRDNTSANRMSQADSWYVRYFNHEEFNRIPTYVTLLTYPITDVSVLSNYFKVAGDVTTYFPVGRRFNVRGSTGNDTDDGADTTSSSAYADGKTQINVVNDITNSTADGNIACGHIKFLQAGTYIVRVGLSSVTTKGAVFRLANIDGFTYTTGYVNVEGATKTDGLRSGFVVNGIPYSIWLIGTTMLTVAANDIYEVQHRTDYADTNTYTAGRTSSSGGRDVHAWIEISL